MIGSVAVDSLGKRYRIYPNKRAKLIEWLARTRYTNHTAHWALRHVSFHVQPGESVGIIGLNGAGKSTLLRVLTGSTRPTEGTVRTEGRLAAVLELGLGMHPEFSGWENATLACQLAGMDRRAIAKCLPAIHAYSELDDAMNHPVRTYSTGMHVRLAFSVAVAVRPDILIIDEALAVGDAYFQHKCVARIRSFNEQGTTLLLVTHDPNALKALCQRAILLDGGTLRLDGSPDAVLNHYNAMIALRERDHQFPSGTGAGSAAVRSGSHDAMITSIELRDADGQMRRRFAVGETARIEYRIRIQQAMPAPTVGFLIRDRLGVDVFGTNTHLLGQREGSCATGTELTVTFEVTLELGCGVYSISAAVHRGRTHLEGNYDWWDHALAFEVVSNGGPPFVGVAALPTRVVRIGC